MIHSISAKYIVFFFLSFAINCNAQTGEYYYQPKYFDHVFMVLKLKSDCSFEYYVHNKGKDSLDLGIGKYNGFYWSCGTYEIHSDTLSFFYKPLPCFNEPLFVNTTTGEQTYLSPTPVSWYYPPRPKFLIIRKSRLYFSFKKKQNTNGHQRKKAFYIRKDNSEFNLIHSKCRL